MDCVTAVCQYSVFLILYFESLYKYNNKLPFFPKLLVMQWKYGTLLFSLISLETVGILIIITLLSDCCWGDVENILA